MKRRPECSSLVHAPTSKRVRGLPCSCKSCKSRKRTTVGKCLSAPHYSAGKMSLYRFARSFSRVAASGWTAQHAERLCACPGTSRLLHTSCPANATDIVVPSMGDSISEGSIANVLKKANDHVEEDEPILQIETDKVQARSALRSAVRSIPHMMQQFHMLSRICKRTACGFAVLQCSQLMLSCAQAAEQI
jgi:hypothetical protein